MVCWRAYSIYYEIYHNKMYFSTNYVFIMQDKSYVLSLRDHYLLLFKIVTSFQLSPIARLVTIF